MKRSFFLSAGIALLLCLSFAGEIEAAPAIPALWKVNLTLKYEYHNFTLNLGSPSNADFFRAGQGSLSAPNTPMGQNPFFCSEDPRSSSPEVSDLSAELDTNRLAQFLKDDIAPKINHPAVGVTISRDDKGAITFDGAGEFGQELDIDASVGLIQTAVTNGINMVTLAVKKTEPVVTVNDPELQGMGIQDLLSVGWSNFQSSPSNRRHNIQVGESRFNGVLIAPGEVFSFNQHLGKVDGSTGYLKELVIAGPNTVPEFGGGLCQVSSTAYRGAMMAGFPIVERKNHSYAVSYYAPIGSDATIYPGSADLRFQNDTAHAVLIQTRIKGDDLYFHYYGSTDDRQVSIFGPYISNPKAAPAPVHRTSTNIPVGSTQQLSGIHPGMDALWFRRVEKTASASTSPDQKDGEWQNFFSHYQARGLVVVTGVAKTETPPEPSTPAPAEFVD